MTFGYGAPEILRGGFGGFFASPEVRDRNFAKFSEALLGEVLPRVESLPGEKGPELASHCRAFDGRQ